MSKERQLKILMERSPGIPLMLSVLADVGGVMAGILQVVAHYHHGGRGHLNQQDHQHHNWHDQMFHQVTWGNNKDRLRMLAEKFRILSPRSKHRSSCPHGFTVRNWYKTVIVIVIHILSSLLPFILELSPSCSQDLVNLLWHYVHHPKLKKFSK